MLFLYSVYNNFWFYLPFFYYFPFQKKSLNKGKLYTFEFVLFVCFSNSLVSLYHALKMKILHFIYNIQKNFIVHRR